MSTRAERLATERNVWVATTRPDGRPHLTPIWFVFVDARVWLCTGAPAVKARNLRANSSVSFALENGSEPVTGEGVAVVHAGLDTVPGSVLEAFRSKYDWDLTTDATYQTVIEISITKWLHPGDTVVE